MFIETSSWLWRCYLWSALLENCPNTEFFLVRVFPHSPNNTYNCFNTKGIKHLTKLRLGLSHLRDHKFKHGFLDSLNPLCSCGFKIKTTCLLHCPNFINGRSLLLNNVSRLTKDKLTSCDTLVTQLLLDGDNSSDLVINTLILTGADPKISKKGGVLCRPPWFQVSDGLKRPK